jgi:hypothetical protein
MKSLECPACTSLNSILGLRIGNTKHMSQARTPLPVLMPFYFLPSTSLESCVFVSPVKSFAVLKSDYKLQLQDY